MVPLAGIAISVVANTIVPDVYRLLKSTLGLSVDEKLNRAYHDAVAAVLDDANHRIISGMRRPAPEGSESYRLLTEFLHQTEFVTSVVRTISYSNPLPSDRLSIVYPPKLSQTVPLDSLLDCFHTHLQHTFIAEFGQDLSPRMPLLLALLRAAIAKVQLSVDDGVESILNTVDEGFESVHRKLEAVLAPTGTERAITPWLGRPGSIGDRFVGRSAALKAVGQSIADHRLAVISGGAGSGKTRLVTEYSHRSKMNGFWTIAGNNVDATLAALAPSLNIDIASRGDEDVAAEVRWVLAGLPLETLWVIDNLKSLEQVNPLLNAVGLRLLITSRNDRSQELSTNRDAFKRLPELDLDSAIQWLATASGSNLDNPALGEIVQLVGALPLALEMLAIHVGDYGQTPERVRDDLKKSPTPIQLEKFREAGGTTIDHPQGVYNAITGTLAVLPPEVREGISPLGYLADAPIPHAFLRAATGIEDEELGELIEACRRSSIVSVVEREVVVHALTIAAIAATNPEGMLGTTLRRARERLSSINQDDSPELKLEIGHHENIFYESRKALGPGHRGVVMFAGNLADSYRNLVRYFKYREGRRSQHAVRAWLWAEWNSHEIVALKRQLELGHPLPGWRHL